MVDENGILFTKKISNDAINYYIDADYSSRFKIVIINSEFHESVIKDTIDNILYINVNKIKYYGMMEIGLVLYDESNKTMFLYSTYRIESKYHNTMEIDTFNLGNVAFYIYIFSDIPPVDQIFFSEYIIIINSNNKIFYQILDRHYNRSTYGFREIKTDDTLKCDINFDHIIHTESEKTSELKIKIDIESDPLDKLSHIFDMIGIKKDYTIVNVDMGEEISYGDGATRNFYFNAISQLGKKYFIKHNYLTEFNRQELDKLSNKQLFNIGLIIRGCLFQLGSHINLRLPIELLCKIKSHIPSIEELEYFAKKEDSSYYDNACKIKNDINFINEYGFSNFYSLICDVVKYKQGSNDNICSWIARGFNSVTSIKNIEIMNIPTLDYFISGFFVIDRKNLIKNIVYDNVKDNYLEIIKSTIEKIIMEISDSELDILVKNWHGSIPSKNQKFTVIIMRSGPISFLTCPTELIIPKNMIQMENFYEIFKHNLITEINFMIDD